MTIIDHRFDTRDALFSTLQQVIVADIERALQHKGAASLLLSGGSTPAPLYRGLSRATLDWDRVHVALVDERWVAVDDAASNERLLRESLLTGRAAQARFTGMKNTAASALEGVKACNLDYARLPLPHTFCLLGMGPDGHTASLFPQAQGLDAALASRQHCAAIHAQRSTVTGELLDRMTLTPWSILQSERLVLLITGADKWEVLQQAKVATDATLTPISYFADQQTALEVYWAP
jgi:6-phosphogluconolactonase